MLAIEVPFIGSAAGFPNTVGLVVFRPPQYGRAARIEQANAFMALCGK